LNDTMLLVDTAISTATYAARAAIHQTLNISPGVGFSTETHIPSKAYHRPCDYS